MSDTGHLVVEIHVPLAPSPGALEGEYAFTWIDEVDELLADLDAAEVSDDAEEWEGEYLFFVAGATEDDLLTVAHRVAEHPQVPPGVYAVVTDSEADAYGVGRRVELS